MTHDDTPPMKMYLHYPFQITQTISNAPTTSGPTVATRVHSRPCKVPGTSHPNNSSGSLKSRVKLRPQPGLAALVSAGVISAFASAE